MDKKKMIIFAIVLIVILVALIAGTQSFRSKTSTETNPSGSKTSTGTVVTANKKLNPEELFTDRDLKQEVDTKDATKYEVEDNTDIQITSEGTYVLTGTAKNVTINVTAGDDEKVQLVLDNLNIENEDKEGIHIENADKVFVTLNSQSTLSYKTTDAENATAAILSRSDITFNGIGTFNITSDNNGIVGKDDVKITGGTYNITATKNAIRANDSIRISDGTFNIKAGTDGLHAENNDDDTKGYIYIGGGNFTINAGDDAIHAVSVAQIDGGTFSITTAEGIEGTYVQINGGTITISASDDGINAARKSSAYEPTVEINGGDITIEMGKGDTDGVDSNGDIIINGGTISVTGNSTFDYDGKAEHNGGTVIVNGEETDTITNQFGGGMPGGFGGFGGGRGNMDFPQDFSGDFGDFGGRGFSRDGSGDFGGKNFPQDFSGDFNFDGQTPPDFDGEFNPNMTPPDFSTEMEGKKQNRGNRQKKAEQESEQTTNQESTENII